MSGYLAVGLLDQSGILKVSYFQTPFFFFFFGEIQYLVYFQFVALLLMDNASYPEFGISEQRQEGHLWGSH